jgi:AMP deaminase
MCPRPEYPRVAEDDPRPPSPTVGPLTPSVDDEVRSSPSFDYHQERRLQLKDEIWLSHHLPRLPPKTDDDGAPTGPKAVPPTSPGRSRTTPKDLMIGVSQALDPSPSAFHPPKNDLELGNVQRGGRSMSMDDDDGEEEEEEDHRHGGSRDMLSPMSSMSPKDTMIHRTELDDQERLDLEEEAREREISGQGFSGAQTSGQPAAVPAGKYLSFTPPFFFPFILLFLVLGQ